MNMTRKMNFKNPAQNVAGFQRQAAYHYKTAMDCRERGDLDLAIDHQRLAAYASKWGRIWLLRTLENKRSEPR